MYMSVLDVFFGPTLAAQVEVHYPIDNYYSPTAALNAVFTDQPYRCGTRYVSYLSLSLSLSLSL